MTPTKTILIVDDERMICDLAITMLWQAGFSAISYTDPKEALEFFKSNWRDIGVVLLDIMMPEMPGPDLLVEMRKINPDILSVFMSGYLHEKNVAGAKYFIDKPFKGSRLITVISSALGT